MLNFLDFVLLIILVVIIAVLLFLSTGIIYTKDNHVSLIKKGNKIYKIENRKFTYYFPIIFRKVAHYPVKPSPYKINKEIKYLEAKDVMLLYKHKVNIKKLIKQNKNLKETFKKYRIVVTNK